jgi:uncharacterized protein (TIGR02270 family)
MPRPAAPIVEDVLQQHVDDAIALSEVRERLHVASYVGLRHLSALDRRISAHVDGLRLAGESAWGVLDAALERPSPGSLFAAMVRAVEEVRQPKIDDLLALAEAEPDVAKGVYLAFGWLEPARLRGVVTRLLESDSPFRIVAGLTACTWHGVDPGVAAGRYTEHDDLGVRVAALRAAASIGRRDAVSVYASTWQDDQDQRLQAWAAWCAVLLGGRQAIELLGRYALTPGEWRRRSFELAVQATGDAGAVSLLQRLDEAPAPMRWRIEGCGLIGDPAHVPWLIEQMAEVQAARHAGASFSLITGVDLEGEALDQPAPSSAESGPNDDPDDPNVETDEDDGLPWPEVEKIQRWWAVNEHRFSTGQRYFVGHPVSGEHCRHVLRHGTQRQRALAAQYLCLLSPGVHLFNTIAPAWRQQRLLATMS